MEKELFSFLDLEEIMKILDLITAILVIIGGLNWGLVGLFNFNLVEFLFGGTILTALIYVIVGLSAVNKIIEYKGGLCVSEGLESMILPLPVAGLMSPEDGYEVAKAYDILEKKVETLGTSLNAPFMTLSFMALLVIPSIKISDRGLFDGDTFTLTSTWEYSK